MIIVILGLLLGILIGFYLPVMPYVYSQYMAVAILAALDTVFGGVAAASQGKFNIGIFVSGFFGNALLAAGLTYIGVKLDVDIFLAAIFAFGNRIFINFAIIRRYILNKCTKKDMI